jgi:hypothetical protein
MVPIAGWSSQVARQAHNLKVVGSNPTPATNESPVLRGFRLLHPREIRWDSDPKGSSALPTGKMHPPESLANSAPLMAKAGSPPFPMTMAQNPMFTPLARFDRLH